jgi:hypothetical protein
MKRLLRQFQDQFARFSTDGIAGFDQRSAQPRADLADTEVPPGNVRFSR